MPYAKLFDISEADAALTVADSSARPLDPPSPSTILWPARARSPSSSDRDRRNLQAAFSPERFADSTGCYPSFATCGRRASGL